MTPYKVAVLDDYQNISEPVFAALDRSQFEVTIFRDTLRPYEHPDTTDAEREALIARLQPFDIICMFPPSHIRPRGHPFRGIAKSHDIRRTYTIAP